MVLLDNVHKSFGAVQAVRGVSFELKPGQIAGLLGPNGAGKSTTIRMIAGFLLPDAGRVVISGADTLESSAAARRLLGYMPESNPLYPEMTVKEYLDFRCGLFSLPRALRKKAVEYAIARCWLKEMRSRRIGALSKGYKQRVGLAAAMLHNPKVLILDEPTNGLDPTQIRETRQLVRDLAQERTMLISSHILPEVERLCDRVIIMAGGRVRADGTPADLVSEAGNKYILQTKVVVRDDEVRIQKILENLPYVGETAVRGQRTAQLGATWVEWTVTGRQGAPDLREQISVACQQANVIFRELRAEGSTLEAVFVRLMEEAEGGAAGSAEPAAIAGDGSKAAKRSEAA